MSGLRLLRSLDLKGEECLSGVRCLLDASAVYPLLIELREKVLEYIDLFTVLDLTIYEIGNAIWKSYRRGKLTNIDAITKLFEEVLGSVKKLGIGNEIREVLQIAVENNLTFYDASYLYIARKYGLKLVTEDQELLSFPEAMSVKDFVKELKP